MAEHLDKANRVSVLDDLRDEFVSALDREVHAPRRRRLRPAAVLIAGVCLILGAVTATLLVNTRSDPVAGWQGPPGGGIEASGPTYASLTELVMASDLIVEGTVQETLAGETDAAGTPDEVRHVNTLVRVDNALKGSARADAILTVKTLELAFGGPGPKEWREAGDRVLLFLSPSGETPGLHILANTNYSQTAYLIMSDDLVAAIGDDPLSEEIAALTLAQLRQAVQAAA